MSTIQAAWVYQHPEPVRLRPNDRRQRTALRAAADAERQAQNRASMALELRKARLHDFTALQQMLELYQYELSDIWPQEADRQARYGYNLEHHKHGERFHAYVAVQGSQYVGFALVAPAVVTRKEGKWMEQFFILKRFRRSGAGYALARHALLSHPGAWEVGQVSANLAAQAFWRRVIEKVTSGSYVEVQVTEGWWQGVVQQFHVPAAV